MAKPKPNSVFYPSTIFACQTSEDNRFIRCDFKWCSEHGERAEHGPVEGWILNTRKNVNSLENHVGRQIYNFMNEDHISKSICEREISEGNKHLLESPGNGINFSKILIVFNLRDPQALLGLWIESFIKAAKTSDGIQDESFCCITLSFACRLELMECISQLDVVAKNCTNAEVMVILSCHSSCQGQVFSCTPSTISKDANFEEFCSLHDFVCACQDVLGSILSVIHISSCFTLKMDKSHEDWPVSYSWYKRSLKCLLSGSSKEVYETGSQTADLYLTLSTFCDKKQENSSLQNMFTKAVRRASTRDWSDLANEMGLTIFDARKADTAISLPEENDTVTPPAIVLSPLHVVLVSTSTSSTAGSDLIDTNDAICDAVFLNLQLRKSTDINAEFSKIKITNCVDERSFLETLANSLIELRFNPAKELFLVFFGKVASLYSVQLIQFMKEMVRKNNWIVYGFHFQSMSPILWNRLVKSSSENVDNMNPFPITSMLNGRAPAWSRLPLLLYLLHLAVGENGTLTLRRTTSGQQPRRLSSKWTLTDVYMEASYVLSGVCMDCDLKFISPSNNDARISNNGDHLRNKHEFCDTTSLESEMEEPCPKKSKSGTSHGIIETNSSMDCFDCSLPNVNPTRIESSSKEIGQTDFGNCLEDSANSVVDVNFSPSESNCLDDSKDELCQVCTQSNESSNGECLCDMNEQSSYCCNPRDVQSHETNRSSLESSSQCMTVDIGKPDSLQNMQNCKEPILRNPTRTSPDRTLDSPSKITGDCEAGTSDCANLSDKNGVIENDHIEKQVFSDSEKEQNFKNCPHSLPPMMANVDDVLVKHFILDLDVFFDQKIIAGSILLFIKPTREEVKKNRFQMCLDSTMLEVEAAEEISIPEDFEIHFHDKKCCCIKKDDEISTKDFASCSVSPCRHCALLDTIRKSPRSSLLLNMKKPAYSVHGWCIRLWKEDDFSNDWPRCLRIWYRTKPEGQSIFWTNDQDGSETVFSPGAYINNRSLMPCQEPPVAMSTWQAYFSVYNGATVLMSGNRVFCKESYLRKQACQKGLFCYEMSIALPSSTLALLVGNYSESEESFSVKCGQSQKEVPIKAYAPKSLLHRFTNEFLYDAGSYLMAASSLLGEYPFSRLDLVLMPRCFACLGLKSPNLAFLSQSLLCGDKSMAVRVAHEICHAWFGLLVGVSDWTEEWLSEGFATYLEERIQYKSEKLSPDEEYERNQLCKAIRYRVLKEELKEADENMKSLRPRPSTSGYISAAEAIRKNISTNDNTDKCSNNMIHIPSRKWTQIHYLKGYFLLCHLANMVGTDEFDRFLFKYVQRFRECLVNSEHLDESIINCNGRLISEINEKLTWWKKRDSINKRCKTLKLKKKRIQKEQILQLHLNGNQLILLLEKLLDRDCFANQTLAELQSVYGFDKCNAEIRHRWCELVVKHRYSRAYEQVRRFLVDDQGMGVYLFGELIITEDRVQRKLADDAFFEIKDEMDRCTFQTVYEMLNGI